MEHHVNHKNTSSSVDTQVRYLDKEQYHLEYEVLTDEQHML